MIRRIFGHWPVRMTLAVLVGAAIGLAPAATAQPTSAVAQAVCATLDKHPTVAGVAGTLQAVAGYHGLDPDIAAHVVGISVETTCPHHQPLLDSYNTTGVGSPVGKRLI